MGQIKGENDLHPRGAGEFLRPLNDRQSNLTRPNTLERPYLWLQPMTC